jgi:hypothetical protein
MGPRKEWLCHALHKEIPPGLWQAILKYQLRITEEEFWK